MKVELSSCFILHSRPYLESSVILDVFSKEHGRVNLLAKGAKREKSAFSGLLQPYHRLLLSWQGKSNLMTLVDAEPEKDNYKLADEKIISGFYVNELLIRLLHQHEPHPELFDLYDQTLTALASSDNIENILRVYEKGLLEALGYGLVLDHDIENGEGIKEGMNYYYRLDSGPTKAQPDSENYIEISGKSLLALDAETTLDNESLEESKRLLRFLLKHQLGDKPLSSRALYKAYISK